jgi:CRISPR-associated protein Csb2
MMHLVLTVRFLDDRYHGLLDRGGPPEWPPSPFRLFQALVAGVGRRRELVNGADVPENKEFTNIGKALGWLQSHTRNHPPVIIAPQHKVGQAITRFVPNNDGDKKFDRQERLTAKPTVPTLFILDNDQNPEVHYVWQLPENHDCPVADIERAARSLTALGWGIDMAFADARPASEGDIQGLKGIRWYPKKRDWPLRDTLRTPTYHEDSGECTLCDLRHCHSTFINRIEHGNPLKTVDKPKVFDRVLYTSIERPIGRPHVVFKLADENEDTFCYPHAKLIHIAGMVRHLAIERMKDDPPSWIENPGEWVSRVVRGKRNESAGDDHQQFSYVPLASIGHAHADAMIRNVMIVAPLDMERELYHLADRLDGLQLKPEGDSEKCKQDLAGNFADRNWLQRFNPPPGKFIAKGYLGTASVWETVTPVILDGHRKAKGDDARAVARTTERLIRKALARAGIEAPCEFTWQMFPFIKNALSAHERDKERRLTGYFRPDYLQGRGAVHVRLSFGRRAVERDMDSAWTPIDVSGPLMIGAGRHCGLGVFATVDERPRRQQE